MGGNEEEFSKMDVQSSSDRFGGHHFGGVQIQERRKVFMGCSLFGLFLFALAGMILILQSKQKGTELAFYTIDLPEDVVPPMNLHVHPCHDFFKYSCGNWVSEANVPSDKGTLLLSFSNVSDRIQQDMQEIMQGGWPLIGELYNSCMNTSLLDQLGIDPIRDVLQQIESVSTKSQVFELAGKLSRTIGLRFLTALRIQPDIKQADHYAMYVSQTGLTLGDAVFYTKQDQWKEFEPALRKFIRQLFALAEFPEEKIQYFEDSIVNLESQIATLFVPAEQLQDPSQTYHPQTFAQSIQTYPLLFGAYLNGTLMNLTQDTREARIIMETPSFFVKAEQLVAQLDVAKWKLLLLYHVLKDTAPWMTQNFVRMHFDLFQTKIHGQQAMNPRWQTCVAHVSTLFPELSAKYFYLKEFDHISQQTAQQLVSLMEQAMDEFLTKVTWLDDPSTERARQKLALVANLVGGSTSKTTWPLLLDETKLVSNVAKINEYHFQRQANKLFAHSVDRNEWTINAATPNAFYDVIKNQLVFPAGILQAPFFDVEFHPARNFGAIGAMIGHEMSHGFDDLGKFYDGTGNLAPWWSDKTQEEFTKRSQCLVDQYNGFQVISQEQTADSNKKVLGNVNGKLTLTENIADNGGLKMAFYAYQKYHDAHLLSDELIANSKLSTIDAERLFFISYAQTFCGKTTDAAMLRRIQADRFAPEHQRVNGAIMNNLDFNRVFECSVGTPMNPPDVCEMW